MKSIQMCAEAPPIRRKPASFQRWRWIVLARLHWGCWKVLRSGSSRSCTTGRDDLERHIWQIFVVVVVLRKISLPENVLLPRNQQRDEKTKKKPPPQPREREPRIKTTTKTLRRRKKKNTQKQNKPRSIWILCRNHNLYIPSTIMYN